MIAVLALSLAAVLSLGPPTDDDAAQVLARARSAAGIENMPAQGIAASGSLDIVGTHGTYSLLFSGSRACLQRVEGPVSLAAAINGDDVWITDIGGETRAVRTSDKETWELTLLPLNHGWLAPDAPLEFTVDHDAATDDCAAVAFSLKNGRATGRALLSRSTWLLREWRFKAGSSETIMTLDGHAPFAGVQVPRRIVTDGPTRIDVTIDSVAEAPVFFRSPYEMIAGAPGAAFEPGIDPALEVVRAPTGHVLVHPLLDGKDVGWFIFDTGAGSMVLSTPVAAELGIETFGAVPANGVGGRTQGGFCRPESITLGPVTMERPLMVTLDLAFLEQHMGRRIAGLVGYNLLARVVARIDMQTPAISLHDPADFDGGALAWQDLVLDQRVPQVLARFEDHEGWFRLDTGAAQMSVSMHAPAVRELKLLAGRETTDAQTGGVGGMIGVKRGELAWFELAGRRADNVKAEFALSEVGAFADPYSLGNIGGVLLRPFVLVTDYPHGRIAFVERTPGRKQ